MIVVFGTSSSGGAVAQRVESWTCDQQVVVVGSILTRGKAA